MSTTYDRSYAYTRSLGTVGFAEAVERTRRALAAEGFGVITEIDVQATMKNKLGVERRPYLILGACNPGLAHHALEAEPAVGVFLPCNVTVFEGDDGATLVQAIKPDAMFALIEQPAMAPVAREVGERLERVMAAL